MKEAMNIYRINDCYIADNTSNGAFIHYMEEELPHGDLFTDEPKRGEEATFTISVKEVSASDRQRKNIPCCEHGCDLCVDVGDFVYISLDDILKQYQEFPALLAKSE